MLDETGAPISHQLLLGKIKNGISISTAFIIVAAFIYFNPNYLGNRIISVILSIALGGFGVAGLSIELNKIAGKGQGIGLDNLGVGLLFGGMWAVIYYYFPIWWVNILTLVLLLVAANTFILGLINLIENILITNLSIKITIVKVVISVVQLVAFAAAFLQVLQILKFVP